MGWSECSDEALLHATRSDPDAFAELYDRYETALVGYLRRRTGNVEVAVDLAGEVFAAALAAAHRYRPAPGRTAAAWLFTIAQNILRDSLRRGRVEARVRRRIGIRDAVAYGDEELERIEALVSRGLATVVHENVALFQLSGLTVQHLKLRTDALVSSSRRALVSPAT